MTTTAPAGIPATGVPHGAPEGSEQHAPAPRGRRRIDWSWLGLTPFAVYLAAFLVLPTVLIVALLAVPAAIGAALAAPPYLLVRAVRRRRSRHR